MTFIASLVVVTLLAPMAVLSQETQSWLAKIGLPGKGNGPVIATDGSGNVYVAVASPSNYIELVKYNSAGSFQWSTTYTYFSTAFDGIVGVATDASGNAYVVVDDGQLGVVAIKFTSVGSVAWANFVTYQGLIPFAISMTADAAGNVYFTGNVHINEADYLTVKINSSGVQQWAETYNGTSNTVDLGYAIAVDAGGNVYVSGSSEGQEIIRVGLCFEIINTGTNVVTIKYDPNGNALWSQRYSDRLTSADYATGIAVDPSGNVYVAAQITNATSVAISYAANGTEQWVEPTPKAAYNPFIGIDPSGNIITVGYTGSQFAVNKFTPAGSLSWTSVYSPLNPAPQVMAALDKLGNSYITIPVSATTNPTNYNYNTVAFASTGAIQWIENFNGSSNSQDYPNGIAVFTPVSRFGQVVYPTVFVTGTADNDVDVTTVAYIHQAVNELAEISDSAAGLAAVLSAAPANLSNYPNPFRGTTRIGYTLPRDGHVTLQVYSASGTALATLVSANENAGPHSVPFNSGLLAAGIYEYRIVATSPKGNYTATKQMIVQ
jgi:hypothetical protein